MSNNNKAMFLLLAIASIVVILSQPGLAHMPPPPTLPSPSSLSPIIPGLLPWDPEEQIKCWSSVLKKEGCKMEIYRAFSTGKLGDINLICCEAYMAIDSNCWSKMFPFNPFFPPLLKDSCSRIVGKSPVPPHK